MEILDSLWTVRAGGIITKAGVQKDILDKKRLIQYVPSKLQIKQDIDNRTRWSFNSFEEAAMAAAQEIFLVSTLKENVFKRLRDDKKYDLRGDFDRFWGDTREYGIAIYKKSKKFLLTWRRHSGDDAVAPDHNVFGWEKLYVGGVHSHGLLGEPGIDEQTSKFSCRDFNFAERNNKIICLVHTKEVTDEGGSIYLNDCDKCDKTKHFIGVLQIFYPDQNNIDRIRTIRAEEPFNEYTRQTRMYNDSIIKASFKIWNIFTSKSVDMWESFPSVLLR